MSVDYLEEQLDRVRRVQALMASTTIFEPAVILKPEMVKMHQSARVDAFCKIEGGLGVTIGENVHIASFCHINAGGGEVDIGDHTGIASHVVICGGMTDIGRLAITPQDGGRAIRMRTVIGEYVLIFSGAIILPGVTIGDGSVIAAGSLVCRDVPPGQIWRGNPASFHKLREFSS